VRTVFSLQNPIDSGRMQGARRHRRVDAATHQEACAHRDVSQGQGCGRNPARPRPVEGRVRPLCGACSLAFRDLLRSMLQQTASHIRLDIAISGVAQAVSGIDLAVSGIAHAVSGIDLAVSNVAVSQLRAEKSTFALIADADRGVPVSWWLGLSSHPHVLLAVLNSLNPTLSARYDSASAPAGCLEHTREDVLGKLYDWVNQYSPRLSIFWLAGMAGTGKTTIAKTFCDQLVQDGRIIATFFASRQAVDRQDPSNIVRTFAYDLACAFPSSRPSILDFLRSTPAVTDTVLHKLVDKLLANPLVAAQSLPASSRSIVFVIDALDECEKVQNMPSGSLIPLIAAALRELPVKFLVTSRLEPRIRSMFDLLGPDAFQLHNVEDHVVARDVHRYLEDGFSKITSIHHLSSNGWPPADIITTLTTRAGHLFIYASTVLLYVGDNKYDPLVRLAELLGQSNFATDNPYTSLDMVYQRVFVNATQTSGRDGDYLCRRLRNVVGTVIMVREPLHAGVLALLCKLSEREFVAVMGSLSSVMLAESGTPVQIFHQSFPDYVTDPYRCTDTRFLVVPAQHHRDLAVRCLVIMNQQLRQNICEIRDPFLFNSELGDLAQQLPAELRYASVHWMAHVSSSGMGSDALFDLLSCFCAEHIFHWIEVLSLTGRVLDGDRGLQNVLAWCKVSHPSTTLCTFTHIPYRCTLIGPPLLCSRRLSCSMTRSACFVTSEYRLRLLHCKSIIRSWCSCPSVHYRNVWPAL
jgi:hypothetical protein